MKAGMAFLAGVGTGVALGLAFAPQSGNETRDFLAQKAGTSSDRASAAGKKLRKQAAGLAHQAREGAAEAIESGKEAYREKAGSI